MGPQIEPTVVAITSLMLSLSASVRDEPVMPVSCTVPDTVGDVVVVPEDPELPVAVVLVPVTPERLPPLEVMAVVMAVLVTLVRAVAPAVAAASVCTVMV